MLTITRFLFIIGFFSLSFYSYAYADNEFDTIAVVVNNDVIMQSEAQQRADRLKVPLTQAIEDLIMERLQVQQAKNLGISVEDKQLQQAIEDIAQQNHLTLPAFTTALQQEGIEFNDFREQTKRKLLLDALKTKQLQGKVAVSPEEVNDLIASQSDNLVKGERVHLLHILIALPKNSSIAQVKTAKTKAEQLRQQILNGADFAQVARMQSDSYAAKNGGDLGWQNADKLPMSFNRALALMQVGDISEAIRDEQGFSLLKLLERQGGERQLSPLTHARHILISTAQLDATQAKQKIDSIYQQLQQGSDFSQLARKFSDDTGSAEQGGDLGWVNAGQTVPTFEQTMNQTALNSISPPFQTEFGWHIVQVLERKQADQTGRLLRTKASEFLLDRKAEEQYQAWLKDIRHQAYIDYRLPSDAKHLQLN